MPILTLILLICAPAPFPKAGRPPPAYVGAWVCGAERLEVRPGGTYAACRGSAAVARAGAWSGRAGGITVVFDGRAFDGTLSGDRLLLWGLCYRRLR